MKLSTLFTRTTRENPSGEQSVNAQLLERGGFVYKNSAGVYTYLPLGWRVMQKIAGIIREEINVVGGQEMLMQALVEKKYLDATGRWDVEVGFEAIGKKEERAGFVLGWTHEEVLTEIASKFINSYKDLPFSAYQIQTKFRNEPRAKSGVLRGREFMMKDLYSFHTSSEDLERYYEEVKGAYHKIFNRCGLKSIYTLAAGGDFTANFTHEFQVQAEVGEDTIFVCTKCEYAENNEISKLKAGDHCPKCDGKIEEIKSIEVGNIFPLGTKYSEAFNLKYVDENGEKSMVVMGSYGIGVGRVMGTVVEVHHDERGIIWPESIAPYSVHLISLDEAVEKESHTSQGHAAGPRGLVRDRAEKLYKELQGNNVEVLFDDRSDKSAGEKFADADLLGIPTRLVVSKKTVANESVEVKKRTEKESRLVPLTGLNEIFK